MTWRNTTPQVFPVRPQLGPWRGKLDLVVGKEDAAGGEGEVVAVEEDVVPAEEGEEAAVTEGGGTEQQNEPTNQSTFTFYDIHHHYSCLYTNRCTISIIQLSLHVLCFLFPSIQCSTLEAIANTQQACL